MVPPLPSARKRSHPAHLLFTHHLLHPHQLAQQTESQSPPQTWNLSMPWFLCQSCSQCKQSSQSLSPARRLNNCWASNIVCPRRNTWGIWGDGVEPYPVSQGGCKCTELCTLNNLGGSWREPYACFVALHRACFVAQQRVIEVFDVPALPPSPTNSDA